MVTLDLLYERGLLYFVIKNYSLLAATDVKFVFDRKITGVDGQVEITGLNIFKNLRYLAPQKEIKIFIDVAAAFFARKGPNEIGVKISWLDENGEKRSNSIQHNFRIYEDLGYINPNQLTQ